jgi:hypothetical protein
MAIASGGGAGNRTPLKIPATFEAFPGPANVTYGQLIAYKATLKNDTGTTLTHVKFRQIYPEVVRDGNDPVPTGPPVDSNCPTTPTTVTVTVNGVAKSQWICEFGSVAADADQLTLIVVWNVPSVGSTTVNCDGCLTSTGRWTVKEGANDVADPNDTFPKPTGVDVPATLLAIGGTQETKRAGGYETAGASCGDTEAAGNLGTNAAVSAENPVSTTVCLPPFALTAEQRKLGLGYATTITEASARSAQVCIADLGKSCDDAGVVDATFADGLVTHIFHVAVAGLPKNYEITTVSHDGVPLDACPVPNPTPDPDGCVSITPPKGNYKIWIIVATAPKNGLWDW